jgi:proteasome lid subunit RPN8/RPN11
MKEKVWEKIQNYSKYAYDEHKSEIGGMLLAEKDNDGRWHLHSPVILEQEISAGNTALSKEALASYYTKTAMKHKGRDIKFVWWHSHHTMDVFWSSTDLTAIDEMNQGDWSISLVVNLKEEYKLRVNIWKPFPAVVDDVDMEIVRKEPQMPKSIVNEVEKLCSTYSPVVRKVNSGYDYWKYRNNNYKSSTDNDGQTTLWTYNNTNEDRIQIRYESKVEDLMFDANNNTIDYQEFCLKAAKLNTKLLSEGSNLRVGMPNQELFDMAVLNLEAEDFFYENDEKWDCQNKLIERDAELEEYAHWNYSFSKK